MSVGILEHGNLEEATQMQLAMEVGDALNHAYPNHLWLVSFQGGGIIIRHLLIQNCVAAEIGRDGFGSLLPKNKVGTPKEIRKQAIEHGGALLELFGMKRGAWDGESVPEIPSGWRFKQERNWA